MSKYKVKFWCDSGANAFSCNTETVDLVDDWNYTEDEAKEIFESEPVYDSQVDNDPELDIECENYGNRGDHLTVIAEWVEE